MLYKHIQNNWSVFNIINSSVYHLGNPTVSRQWLPDYYISKASLSTDYVMFYAYVQPEGFNQTTDADANLWFDYDRGWFLFNLHTQEYEMISEPGHERIWPDIENNFVVWCGETNEGNKNVYLYNISNKTEINITDDEISESKPKISGNNIVFRKSIDGSQSLILYKLA